MERPTSRSPINAANAILVTRDEDKQSSHTPPTRIWRGMFSTCLIDVPTGGNRPRATLPSQNSHGAFGAASERSQVPALFTCVRTKAIPCGWCRSPQRLQFRSSGGSQWLRSRSDGAGRSGSARGLFSRRGDGYTLLPGERLPRTVWCGTSDGIAGQLSDRRPGWLVSSAMLTRLVAGGGSGSCEAYRRTPRTERG